MKGNIRQKPDKIYSTEAGASAKQGEEQDIIKFIDSYFYPVTADFEQYGAGTSTKFYGIGPFKLYTDNPINAKGDKYHIFKIGFWRNSESRVRIDSVYIKSFTTFTDTIYY